MAVSQSKIHEMDIEAIESPKTKARFAHFNKHLEDKMSDNNLPSMGKKKSEF